MNFNDIEQNLEMIIATTIAFMVLVSIGYSLVERDRFSRRIKVLEHRRNELRNELRNPETKKRTKVQTRAQRQAQADWMRGIVNRLQVIQDSQRDKIQRALVNAGYRDKDAIVIYGFAQLVAPVVLLILGLMAFPVNWENPASGGWKLIAPIAMAYAGLKLPMLLVRNARSKRHDSIRKALPDTLDLMMICSEAGLSLGATLKRVALELRHAYPTMSEEFELTSIEVGLLPDRKKALQNLAFRVDMPELRGFVGVLVQTEKYGTPIAQALRVLATEFREARMLKAEAKAAKLPALMTVPMIVFILPTLFIVIMTPAAISIMDGL